MSMAQTVYSNVVNVKLSGQEMILEFGAVFPEAFSASGVVVNSFNPEVRVVMALSGLKPYAEALQNALKALEHAQAAAPEPTTGQAASK
jgi:hypothetical protein